MDFIFIRYIKLGVFGDIGYGPNDLKNNSRLKKSQQESIRRLSRPNARGSIVSNNFSSEIKPRFWRFATAKSIEDLIRVLRKKRRGKRILKVEDYFFFKKEAAFLPELQSDSISSVTGIHHEVPYHSMNQLVHSNTIYERTIIEPAPQSKSSFSNVYFTDIQVIKPFIQNDVLRILSYGTVSERSCSRNSPISKSLLALSDKSHLIQQCMKNSSLIFKKIDKAIEENKKLTDKKSPVFAKKENPFSQKRKFKNKSFSPLEALSKIEEINNIIDFKKSSHRTDIILPPKYFPGRKTSSNQEEFVKTLQKKLVQVQRSYQHWSKTQEKNLVSRLSSPKTVTKKKLRS